MFKIVDGFKQRADAQVAEPLVILPAGQAAQPAEVHDFEYVTGVVRHRDDIVSEGIGADFLLHVAHDIEHFQGFPCVIGKCVAFD